MVASCVPDAGGSGDEQRIHTGFMKDLQSNPNLGFCSASNNLARATDRGTSTGCSRVDSQGRNIGGDLANMIYERLDA